VCVLSLERSDGCTFTQLGKLDDGSVTAQCVLPGMKQNLDGGLGMPDFVQTLLERKLKPLVGRLKFTSMSKEETQKASEQYGGLSTKYRRYVFHAELASDLEARQQVLAPGRQQADLMRNRRPSLESSDGSTVLDLKTMELQQMEVRDKMASKLSDIPVFKFPNQDGDLDTMTFFAWINQEERQFLSTPVGVTFTENWLKFLLQESND